MKAVVYYENDTTGTNFEVEDIPSGYDGRG